MSCCARVGLGAGFGGKVMLAIAALGVATTALAGGDAGTSGPGTVSDSPASRTAIGPSNAVIGDYRALVPDGSNLFQVWAGDPQKWYAFQIEPGKTYAVDAFDPNTDYIDGSVSGLAVYDSDGTTTPPAETQVDCSMAPRAPSVAPNFGKRCIVRAFSFPGATLQKRNVYVRVTPWINTSFQIRVREITVYGRWTTNGYDFHVELQNTTADDICAELAFYGDSGMAYTSGAYTGSVPFATLTVPAFGAVKYVLPAGTTAGVSNTDKRGTLRIMACPGPVNFNNNGLHVSTYGFHPTLNQYLYFFPNQMNGGNGSTF